MHKLSRKLFILLILPITISYSQELYPRPTFPDVFQTEIEGTFINKDGVVEIDVSFFYDRQKNRAALFMMQENELTREAYDFDNDQSLVIVGKKCEVNNIGNKKGFFPFTIENGTKKLSSAEEAFFFTNSTFEKSLSNVGYPTLVYRTKVNIPQYGQKNCELTHVFSEPDFELATCKQGWYCNSTIISLSVQCKNEEGDTNVDHIYRFSRFRYEIEDESVFQPPPGVFCKMKNTREMPPFPSYFSVSYDSIKFLPNDENGSLVPVFQKKAEIWYDRDYKLLRVDEFEDDGLHSTFRLFDLNLNTSFTVISSNPLCTVDNDVPYDFTLAKTTNAPNIFLKKTGTKSAVYVGKRNVHGIDYHVWSVMWTMDLDVDIPLIIVEDIYFLQIEPNDDIKKRSYLHLSHIDQYIYEIEDGSEEYKFLYLFHFSINNYRTKPKEWSAFDASSCFLSFQKKKFSFKLEEFSLVKGSQSYKIMLQLFYEKIISITGISVLRISDLEGIFDGTELFEIRGWVIKANTFGWPKDMKEPGLEEVLELLKKAASEGNLSVVFTGPRGKEDKITVLSVEALDDSPPPGKKNCTIVIVNKNCTDINDDKNNCLTKDETKGCFSSASMAAACVVLLLTGVSFGIIGYYVFLKKRRLSGGAVGMKNLQP